MEDVLQTKCNRQKENEIVQKICEISIEGNLREFAGICLLSYGYTEVNMNSSVIILLQHPNSYNFVMHIYG